MKRTTTNDTLRLLLFLFALLAFVALSRGLLGCAPPATTAVRSYEVGLTFHGDTRHDLVLRTAWEESMRAWREFTRGRGRLSVTWDLTEDTLLDYAESPRIVLVPKNAPVLQMASARAHKGPLCSVVVLEPVPVIYLSPDACEVIIPVMIHELGHVLGLEDIERPGAVMQFQFTAADEHECHRVGLCTE